MRALQKISISQEAQKILFDNITTKSWKDLAEMTGVKQHKLYHNARLLGLNTKKTDLVRHHTVINGRRVYLTDEQQLYIADNINDKTNQQMADDMGVAIHHVVNFIFVSGIRRKKYVLKEANDFDNGKGFFDISKWAMAYKY